MSHFAAPRCSAVVATGNLLLLLASVGVSAAAASAAPQSTPTAAPDATYVVIGVPASAVDISLDGRLVQSRAPAKKVVTLDNLSAGRHTVEFSSGDDWTVSSTFESGNGSQDVVLHWPAGAADEPVVTTFVNDLDPVASGEGRLTVAHTAVVPPADILASGKVLFSNIANGEFVTAEVPSSTYSVEVVPTGGGDPLLGPVDLPVQAGVLTRVFAIGAPRDGSMDAVVQVIPVGNAGATPGSVDTGSAGLVDPDRPPASGADPALVVVAVAALALVVVAGVRRRRHG